MIIMESLDTMLSDAVNISAILTYTDTKYHKFRQLKKQMSNISTPSPAATPEPDPQHEHDDGDLNHLESDVISQTVLKTINDDGDTINGDQDMDLDTPVTIGAEFFPSTTSITSCTTSVPTLVQSSQLTCLTTSGKSSI